MDKFYLGLDIGTNSVGIACTDENYNLLRAKGKDLWAVRLFDEAQTAATRRTFRVARRRLQRRAWRIDILQEIFEPRVDDKLFFKRLNNSGFVFEDKDAQLQSPYSLFADKAFTDKDFYKKYKTIYHLRRALAHGDGKFDIRLYYLAIHHIVKYRGHFLFDGLSVGEVRDVKRLFDRLNEASSQVFGDDAPVWNSEVADKFREIALCRDKALNDKKKACFDLFECADSVRKKAAVTLMLGGKEKPNNVYALGEYKEEKSFSFGELTDEEYDAKREIFGDDFEYLDALHGIYNYLMFERVLSGHDSVSDSMITLYDKHKSDLRKLKNLIRDGLSHDEYVTMFKSIDEKHNYVNYIGYTKRGKKKVNVKKCKPDEFFAYVKKFLNERREVIAGKGEYCVNVCDQILADIDNKTFMPKILNADNGLFPYQINKEELSRILNNLCRDYPQFGIADSDGISAADKIISLFEFKIPYFVGPLNTYHSQFGGNSWAVRKQDGKILPWNIEEKIDYEASAEKFMRRMTGKCSYLHGEEVLPRGSIYYQAFDVLNQLNKLKFNNQPISVQQKQNIFNDLFLRVRRVTDKTIINYLVSHGQIPASEAKQTILSGKDGDFKASMSSYITMCQILGENFVKNHLDICEDIILLHSLHTDKKTVGRIIEERYGNYNEIKIALSRLKGITSFKDFGRLSRKFLCELSGGTLPTGAPRTILGELYETNNNLNELLYGEQYCFSESIAQENGEIDGNITYETLEDMYISPQVRRGVWQALKMTDECVRTVGRLPDKIFIEVTRGGGNKGERPVSRQKKLAALYNSVRQTEYDIAELTKELNRQSDMELRKERLYLYFLQLGRCAYSDEPISLDQLNSDMYDVDHIVPRALTKDDSIDNKVLVKSELNRKKKDIYPVCAALPSEFERAKRLWKTLNSVSYQNEKLMSDKKYAALTRVAPLTDDDLRDFINRQIVVAGQSVKAVADLLKRKYGTEVKIVYSKASNVDDFKQRFGIIKCRETNDLHHARDAYLNIVVGNVYDTKFSSVATMRYEKDGRSLEYNFDKLYNKPISGAWNGDGSIAHVKSVAAKHSMCVTRYSYTGKGELYNATVYGKDKGLIARKQSGPYSDTEKYGGYNSLTTGYFSVIQSKDKKGNQIKTIEAIPVLVAETEKTQKGAFMRYLTDVRGLKEPKIILDKLKIKSLLKYNGSYLWIAGKSDNRIIYNNAMQWYTDDKIDGYVKALTKLCSYKAKNMLSEDELKRAEYYINTNRKGDKKLVVNADENLQLYDAVTEQLAKPFYGGASGFTCVRKKMIAKRAEFQKLSVLEQAQTLLGCIHVLQCNGTDADLSKIGESNRTGTLKINNNITNDEVFVINLSECGFTEKRQKL